MLRTSTTPEKKKITFSFAVVAIRLIVIIITVHHMIEFICIAVNTIYCWHCCSVLLFFLFGIRSTLNILIARRGLLNSEMSIMFIISAMTLNKYPCCRRPEKVPRNRKKWTLRFFFEEANQRRRKKLARDFIIDAKAFKTKLNS